MLFTSEEIDHTVQEMASKAAQCSEYEVLRKMTREAQALFNQNPELRKRMDHIVQDAFLEGVAATMIYVGAIFQRRAQQEDDA
jgi:hypothetical protein